MSPHRSQCVVLSAWLAAVGCQTTGADPSSPLAGGRDAGDRAADASPGASTDSGYFHDAAASDPADAASLDDASDAPEPQPQDASAPDAHTEVDPEPHELDAVCYFGADAAEVIESTQAGSCSDPHTIDMRARELGEAIVHEVQATATDADLPGLGKCGEESARNITYEVRVPSGADLEVSVDARTDSDTTIRALEGVSSDCSEREALQCVDDAPDRECEYLRVRPGAFPYAPGPLLIVISEAEPSGNVLNVRFRLIDAGGGS